MDLFSLPAADLDAENRRQPAPHPGPALRQAYLEPIGLSVAALAAHVGTEAGVLEPMLAGERSIDVETAIRLGRSLQINPQTLMERQVRHDFARLREDAELETVPLLPHEPGPFPDIGFIRGSLAGLPQTWGYGEVRPETLGFFADADGPDQDFRARMHDLGTGALLRVYDPQGRVLWQGPVLATFEGGPLLPSVRPSTWIAWFVNRYRADLVPAHG